MGIIEERELYLNAHSEQMYEEYKQQIATFRQIFDESEYAQLRTEGKVRLSYVAMQAALMIMLYREEPALQMPFKVLEESMEMDSLLTKWRNAHAQMVHRMLGSKMGTGGSSGFHYLRTAATHHKVMGDFFNLSTYMIPKSSLPQLPNSLTFFMNFPTTPKASKSCSHLKSGNGGASLFSKELPPFNTLKRWQSMSPMKLSKAMLRKDTKSEDTHSNSESYEDVE